jgi:hypothetical protein
MGMPRLKNKDKNTVMHIRMPIELWRWLKGAADKNGRTLRGEIVNRLEASKNA